MRNPNKAKASEILADLQKLIEKYGDLDCIRDDYGYYDCVNVIYVKSAEEAGRQLGPYQPRDACFLIQ